MKLSSLVCVAWMLTAQLSAADDAGSAVTGGATPLPPSYRIPASAQNAGEAPRWNPQAAQAAPLNLPAPPAQVPDSSTIILPADANNPNPPPRPLVSVMKRRNPPATAATPSAASATVSPSTLAGPQNAAPALNPTAITSVIPTAAPAPLTDAPPATLTPSQVAGALPLNPATSAPPPVTAAVPSGVLPAEYDQPIAPTGPAPNINGNSEIPGGRPEGLQPLDAPVQLATPPSDSIPTNKVSDEPPENQSQSPPPGTLIRTVPAGNPPAISDAEVIPSNTQTSEGTVDLGQQAAARAAAEMLATSLDPAAGNADWVSLSQLLVRCPESERAAVAQAYWRLSIAVRAGNWATDEQKRLEEIAVAHHSGAVDGPMLSTARAAAAARVTDAELEAATSWATLVTATHSSGATGKYIPSDAPLVAPYNTFYSQIFANHENARAWEIDHALPIRWRTISDRAAAVQSAASAVHYAEQAHAKNETDLRTLLGCIDDLHTQRREFLNAVLQYNLDVAEYAAAAAPTGTPPEKFVAMLIHAKPAERLSAVPDKPAMSTFGSNVSAEPNSVRGIKSRELPPPPTPGSDGWVPSTLRPIEPERLESVQTSPGAGKSTAPLGSVFPQREATPKAAAASPQLRENETPNRAGQQPDPFAMPPADNRYNNQYDNRYDYRSEGR